MPDPLVLKFLFSTFTANVVFTCIPGQEVCNILCPQQNLATDSEKFGQPPRYYVPAENYLFGFRKGVSGFLQAGLMRVPRRKNQKFSTDLEKIIKTIGDNKYYNRTARGRVFRNIIKYMHGRKFQSMNMCLPLRSHPNIQRYNERHSHI